MKQTKTWALVALTALMGGLTSCSEKDDLGAPPAPAEVKNVAMKISASSLTRGVSEGVDGGVVSFNSGYIYFVSKTGRQILHRVDIVAGEDTETDASGKTLQINLDELLTGTTINKIPVEEDDLVFVVGNTSSVSTITGGAFSQVENAVLAASGEVDALGKVSNVTLFGGGSLEYDSTTIIDEEEETITIETYSVKIPVGPAITARIEIPYLYGGDHVTSFRLRGIYIGRTYASLHVNGAIPSGGNQLGTSTGDSFVNEYPAELDGILYDAMSEVSSGSGEQRVSPASGLWAYNVLTYNPYYVPDPTLPVLPITTVTHSPSVIFVIDQIKTDVPVGISEDATYYITVQGFLEKGTSTEVGALQAGYIYRMSAGLEVSEETVTDKPNVEQIDIEVEIQLASWEMQEVDPKL